MEALAGESQAGWQVPAAIADHAGALAVAGGLWAGAGLYFGAPVELPWGWLVLAVGLMGLLLAVGLPQKTWLVWGVLALGAGIVLGQAQVERTLATFAWDDLGRAVWVTGIPQGDAVAVKDSADRAWVTLAPAVIYVGGAGHVAKQVRVTVAAARLAKVMAARQAGENGLALEALLWAPEGPRQPLNWGTNLGSGGRDYRLWRFLSAGEGLRGYVRGELRPTYVPPVPAGWLARGNSWLDGLRLRIADGTQHDGEGVVPALLVGDWRYVTQQTSDDYRRSGLTHLLAISGYQLTVVGGGLFLLIRWLCAWFPWLALRVDTKRWAAVVALLATAFYALLAGAEVSVLRALVMLALLFAAVLAGRMRSLLRAWALAVMLLVGWNPAAVMGAGFQLSFAAVLALVLLGIFRGKDDEWWVGGWLAKLWLVLLTGLVATLATEPIVALDFGQVSVVGLVANLGAEPAMAFLTWLGMLVLAAWPLGYWGWHPVAVVLGWGVTAVNGWAHMLAGWPGAQLLVPTWGGWLLMGLSWAALLAVYLGRKAWVIGCLVGLAIAIGGLSYAVPVYTRVVDGAGRDVPPTLRYSATGEGEGSMPVLPAKTAWAGQRRDGTWHFETATCGRVWQRFDKACTGE